MSLKLRLIPKVKFLTAKFLRSFLKTIVKFFHISKFHQKFQDINFCTPMFLCNFYKISSQMIIIRSYTIMSTRPPLRKLKVFWNFIKIFQQPYQLISKRLGNFLKMFVKLLSAGRTERIIQGVGEVGSLKMPTQSLHLSALNDFFSVFLIFATLATQCPLAHLPVCPWG